MQHFNLADFPVNFIMQFVSCFYYKEYCMHIMEVLIFYADKLMMMGSSKTSCVFNFVILLKS